MLCPNSKVLLLFFIISVQVFSQNKDPKYSFGVMGGYAQFNINEVIDFLNQGNSNYENNQGGLVITSYLDYGISKSFYLSLDVSYYYSSNSGNGTIIRTGSNSPDILGYHNYEGKCNTELIPISLRIFHKNSFAFFTITYGIGVNYYLGNIEITRNFNEEVKVGANPKGISSLNNSSSDSGLGFSIIVKPELYILSNWFLVNEINYSYGNILAAKTFSDECKIDINGFSIKFGVGLNF